MLIYRKHHVCLFYKAMVLYMSSSFWLLGVESRDFSHAEKERTACKAEQINSKRQPRTILNENSCHFVNLLNFLNTFFFLSLRKIT